MRIKIEQNVIDKCIEFANARMPDSESLYKLRGELKVDKIKQDIINGAIAEFAAQQYLSNYFADVSEPDLTIHKKKKKTFGADLKANDKEFHVKSQTKESSNKYGLSWLFQKTDKLFKNKATGNTYLVLCEIDMPYVDIKAVVNLETLQKYDLLAAPKIKWYAETKVAIYYSDLEKLDLDLFELALD